MSRVMDPIDELQTLRNKSTKSLSEVMQQLLESKLNGSVAQQSEALNKLAYLLKFNHGIGDLLGRRRTMLELKKMNENQNFADEPPSNVNNFKVSSAFDVSFNEAIESILDKEMWNQFGRGADSFYNSTVKDVWNIYSPESRNKSAFGLFNINQQISGKVDSLLRDALEEGKDRSGVIKNIKKETGNWSSQYADNVYRTQSAQAYSAGRFRQLSRPEVKRQVGGIRFDAINDSRVRDDHFALDDFVGPVSDPIWSFITPPVHFNCRCSISLVSHRLLKQQGYIDNNGKFVYKKRVKIPKDNFGQRPDKRVYGAIA